MVSASGAAGGERREEEGTRRGRHGTPAVSYVRSIVVMGPSTTPRSLGPVSATPGAAGRALVRWRAQQGAMAAATIPCRRAGAGASPYEGFVRL